MLAADVPHVRIWKGDVYVERVPNYWVLVCSTKEYSESSEEDRKYLLSKALKTHLDFVLPPRER